MISQKNILLEYISNNTVGAGDLVVTGTVSDLTLGQVAFIDLSGNILADNAAVIAADKFRLALGTASTPRISDTIIYSNLTLKNESDYAVAVEKIEYIGYTGVAGSIDVLDDNLYGVNFNLQTRLMFLNKDEIKQAWYKSAVSGATQADIANGLLESMVLNFAREVEGLIKFEMLTNSAGVANTGAGNLIVQKGSKYGTFATNADAVLAIGDFLRIGGGAVTDPVYKVVGIDTTSNVVEFATAYQGVDATVLEANTEVVTAVASTTADFGIKMTGVALKFIEGEYKYEKSRWKTRLKDFGETTTLLSVDAYEGKGTYEQVAEIEWYAQKNETNMERLGTPPVKYRKLATEGNTYATFSMNWYSVDTENAISFDAKSYKQVLLFTNFANTALTAAIKTILGIA